VNAVGGDFYLGDTAEGEEKFYEVFGRLFGGLFEDMGDGVGDGGLEGYSSGAEAGEVYADELAWFEHGSHVLYCGLQVEPAPVNVRAVSWQMQRGRREWKSKLQIRKREKTVFAKYFDILASPAVSISIRDTLKDENARRSKAAAT
jgi:hypothetical protein